MPVWLRTLLLLAGLAWVGAVYAPYLGSDGGRAGAFLGSDLAVLGDAAGGAQLSRAEAEPLPLQEMAPATYAAAGGERGSVLTGASLALSRRLWGVEDSSATVYRVENLLLLLAAGLGLANFVRRLLLPWTGADHARAAARALPVVLLLHPLTVQAVVDLAGRAELLYLGLASWAAASYLRARQDRKPVPVLVALVLVALAGLAGRSGLGLPLVLAVAEFAAVQRYQGRRLRLRRAAFTFLVTGVVGALDSILRWLVGAGDLGGAPLVGPGSPLERLGVLVVPVPVLPGAADAPTGLWVALAVALVLASMHPALRAARWAPRLWGWLLGGWFLGLFLAALGGEQVGPGDVSRAETLLVAAAFLVSGLVVVATGVQGSRRLALPVVLALGFGCLSLAQVGHHGRAAAFAAELRGDLDRALVEAEALRLRLADEGLASLEGPQVLVVETPAARAAREALALEPFEGGIGHLADGSLTGVTTLRLGEARRRPALVSVEALAALTREPEFAALRRGGVVLVVPDDGGEAVPAAADGPVPGAPRRIVALDPPTPPATPPAWRGDASSPDLALDPLAVGALVVDLPDEPLPSAAEPASEVRFLALEGGPERGVPGLWLADRGRAAGLFDLSSDLDWLTSGGVGRMWLPRGVARVEACTFLPELPGPSGAPVLLDRQGADLVCALPALDADLVARLPEGASWSLGLLGLDSFDHLRLTAEGASPGRLRFARGGRVLDAWPSEDVAWSLELSADGRTIWRHRGRLR